MFYRKKNSSNGAGSEKAQLGAEKSRESWACILVSAFWNHFSAQRRRAPPFTVRSKLWATRLPAQRAKYGRDYNIHISLATSQSFMIKYSVKTKVCKSKNWDRSERKTERLSAKTERRRLKAGSWDALSRKLWTAVQFAAGAHQLYNWEFTFLFSKSEFRILCVKPCRDASKQNLFDIWRMEHQR